MKSHHDLVCFRGVVTSVYLLSKEHFINRQTLMDRWKKLEYPYDIPEEMLVPPVIGGASKMQITLDGMPVTMSELEKISRLTSSTLYRRISVYGQDLKGEHLRATGNNAGERLDSKERRAEPRVEINIPRYDPEDRSPGWCERKYDFLRCSGLNKTRKEN